MAYIGKQPVVGNYILLDDISGSFNGILTSFTLQSGGVNVLHRQNNLVLFLYLVLFNILMMLIQ